MGKNWDTETAKRVFLRMFDDGSDKNKIIGVLKAIFPDAAEGEIVMFVEGCYVQNPRLSLRQKRRDYPSSDDSSGGCAGSSSKSSC